MKKVAILFIVLLTSSFVFAQNTYVPDDKFEQALIDLGYDTTLDDSVVTANISGVTNLNISEKEISDLTGIEDFTALTNLECETNQLTSLDVSNNKALTILHCHYNKLTSLDVSANTALTQLDCSHNQLTSLDVSANTALTHLTCDDNKLTSLDLSNNKALKNLSSASNKLTSLDVSANTALTSLECGFNKLTSLDVSANTALIWLHCSHNPLTSLDVSANTVLTSLQCSNNQLTSLDVSANTALTSLRCHYNKLTSLDVSANTALTNLYCTDNQLTSLDVGSNTALVELYCNLNLLTSLDVSNNTALEIMNCWGNQLTSLDVSANTALTGLACNSNQLTSLDVSSNTALTALNVNYNKLTSLDVSKNTVLKFFKCADNQLTSLDVSKNTALETLDCYVNQLTSLDVSANTALTGLDCNSNQLTSLDVSSNTALTALNVNYNHQLTNLNMRNGITDELTTFNATKSATTLTCIEVLDPAWATANWTSADGNIDAGVTFSVICGAEAVTKWHVATTGSDGSGSGTLASPLATIQTGVNATSDGDTVSVAAGTYKENVLLYKPNGVTTQNISVIGENRNTTIIDGNQNGSVFHIMMNGGLFLKNFTIQNGKGHENTGGGIKVSYGDVVLDSLIVKNNVASGGAFWGINVNLTLKNSIIKSNSGSRGGAILIQNDAPVRNNIVIYNTVFDGNTSYNQGGALWIIHTNVDISESIFKNNSSSEKGTVYLEHCTVTVKKSILINNTSGGNDGAIRAASSGIKIYSSLIANNKGGGLVFGGGDSTAFLQNVTVVNNSNDAGIYANTKVRILNSIVRGNQSVQLHVDAEDLFVAYSNIEGGLEGVKVTESGTVDWNTGNIDKNPSFVKITTGDEESDYHLADWSHAIGAGTTNTSFVSTSGSITFSTSETSDIEDNPRPNPAGSNPDMGAYENKWGTPQNAPPVLSALSDVSVNEDESITVTLEAINADNADNDAITFSATSEKSEVKLSMGSVSGKVLISADENWNGLSKISVEATDGTAFDYGNFTVTFLPVNDKPIIASIASDTTNEETAKSIQVTASDIDGDELSISATTSDNHVVPSVSGMTLTLTPAKDFVGNTLVTVIVNDGSLTDTVSYQFTVLNVNDSPVLSEIKDQRIAEDSEIMVKVVATDVDDTSLSITGNAGSAGISVAFSGNDLTLKPEANWNGSSVITVYASDGKDMDSTKFNLTVDPMQDKPYNFNWVSTSSDSINITQSNLTDTYDLKWNTSNEVDGETIDYLISASVGQFPAEMINETADTSMTITYQDIIDNWYPNLAMLPRATLKFSVSATDGIDTVNVTGDDRVLFVNRYEYLSTKDEGIPVEFALHENYPNPFNPTTTLRFDLPQVSSITLTIYNMLGQKVRTFNMQNTSAGYHSITWDATNDLGEQVGAGVYLYQLQTKDFVKTRKMVLLK